MNFISFVIVLTLTSGAVFAQSDSDIAEQCKSAHPAFSEIFKRNECISNAKKTRAEVEARAKREEAARPCLAKQIPIMETELTNLIKSISPNDTLEVAASKLAKIASKPKITPSDTNIKQMVAVSLYTSSCLSDFYYLINISSGEDGKLDRMGVWVENPPRGYTNGNLNGYRPELSVNFAAKRKAQIIESTKSSKSANSGSSLTSNSDYMNTKSHCAPNLSMKERISRLAAYGEVVQTSERNYRAGTRSVGFLYDGTLSFCY